MDKIEQLIGLFLKIAIEDIDFRGVAQRLIKDNDRPELGRLKLKIQALITKLNRAITIIDSI